MQGLQRLCWIIASMGMLIVLSAFSVTAFADEDSRTAGVTGHPVGLVMDTRAVAYTVDRDTGRVFRLAAGVEPIHYATIEGRPTALAVDRRRTLFVGTESGRVLAVDIEGRVRHACDCAGPVTGLAVDRDGGLLITTKNGALHKVRRRELESE